MGCSSCSNNKTADGVPNGCKSNGNCSSGGCERMSVFNWLADLPAPNGKKGFDVVEVSFKNGRKGFYRNDKSFLLYKGDSVVVEGAPGVDVGVVMTTGELVRHQMKRKKEKTQYRELKKIYRKPTEQDLSAWKEARGREYETMHETREMAIKLGLEMKISDVEYQADGKKATFFYTADQRVDFRELIKVIADRFKVRVEMKQIGARQEAGRLGGIGSCGRELCCSTWLTDFRTVSTSAARYQQLSLNPQKLAGQCGKLKCCLNFELDQYADALKMFPDTRKQIKTKNGNAVHIKTDVFRRMMWYLVQTEKGQNNIVPLEVDRVTELLELNKKGTIPKDLKSFAVVEAVEVEPAYENVVGQDDLTRFDKQFAKKKRNNRNTKNRNNKRRAEAGNKNQNSKDRQDKPKANNSNRKPKANNSNKSRNNNKPKGGNPRKEGGQAQNGAKKNARPNNRNRKPNQNRNNNKPKGNANASGDKKS
ncbi:MAG: hypothetical protein N4A35_16675 [Flavobacteriales bacterium]|jgi:cell fate regulator YaaT (PSP1 superfamily)|nr:hypothetical protein [Flavobacteriales bacterium]